ncbi:hypothetical protein ARALYDRAFT_480397, partial [Arabidopsis lyrata subsp. lyrata]
KWKALMHKTGITVNPDTCMIHASDAWWTQQEFGCKLTKSLNRKPPEFWDVMQRCFVLHDVQSQSQLHEHAVDEEGHDDSYTDNGDFAQTKVPETQEEEEVYRVTIDDDETFQHSASRSQQRGRQNLQSTTRRGSSAHRSGGSSRVSIGSDTIAGYREFQRQSFQQLRPGGFDQDDYDEFKKAEAIFIALNLPKHTRFYWACINALKELVFWPTTVISYDWCFTEQPRCTKTVRFRPFIWECTFRRYIIWKSIFWGGEHHPMLHSGEQHKMLHNGEHHQLLHSGEHHQILHSGSTGTTPTNVQYGFSVGGQGDGATVETSPIIQRTSSSGLGFTNYFETGQMPQTPRPGGLFNIWGTPKGSNASHQSD